MFLVKLKDTNKEGTEAKLGHTRSWPQNKMQRMSETSVSTKYNSILTWEKFMTLMLNPIEKTSLNYMPCFQEVHEKYFIIKNCELKIVQDELASLISFFMKFLKYPVLELIHLETDKRNNSYHF